MTTRTPRLIILATAAALLAAGCGGSNNAKSSESATPTTPSVTTVNPSDMTNQQQAPNRLVIDVTIKGGEVTPTNASLQSKVKEPIVVRVNSDVADELHVTSAPDHTFKIDPRTGQQFQFTVDAPGTFDIKLRQLGRTIASVQVQP